ncbi:histone-lysine N-methyltransferase SETMAR [Nephila pilipes]|uniref:Histone-lysine N-methyltransferase SETMAR n=1 Tax=Nephila pilipes TaxID=299642 RepID=A0A8X6QLH5_NEPPI|nr:histone-lysine N-methyltransferase SETMAR [Nephila pilipes]
MEVSKDLIRSCLLYDFKVSLSAAASSLRISQAFGDRAVNERTLRQCFKIFRSGDLSLCDESRSGQPHVRLRLHILGKTYRLSKWFSAHAVGTSLETTIGSLYVVAFSPLYRIHIQSSAYQ